MDYDYSLTNKENLTKLRDYLAALPDDYENLEMSCFAKNSSIAAKSTPETGCGTPACMVGHGPAAGIPFGYHWLQEPSPQFGTHIPRKNL